MVFVTSFAWKMFYNLKYTQILKDDPAFRNQPPALLKGTFLVPVVALIIFLLFKMGGTLSRTLIRLIALISILIIGLLVIIAFMQSQLENANLSSSLFIFNLIGFIVSIVGLIFIKKADKNTTQGVSKLSYALAYSFMLYIIYLITIGGTIVMNLNTFPDTPRTAMSLGIIFLINFIWVFNVISLKVKWQVIWVFIYTALIAFVCFVKNQ